MSYRSKPRYYGAPRRVDFLSGYKCRCRRCYCCIFNSHPNQNKLGLEEVPTLSYGGSDGGGGDSGGDGGAAPAAAADKTIFKVKVTGFGDKAKIKVCACCCYLRRSSRPTCTSHMTKLRAFVASRRSSCGRAV